MMHSHTLISACERPRHQTRGTRAGRPRADARDKQREADSAPPFGRRLGPGTPGSGGNVCVTRRASSCTVHQGLTGKGPPVTASIILHDYWRSSASYRVRIALNLLGLPYTARTVDLLSGENRGPAYRALNPQGLVPTLEIDGRTLTQSLAIVEYLHDRTPGSRLLPADPLGQYRARQLSHAIAMEIHPICNLSVANHAAALAGGDDAVKSAWMQHFIGRGLSAVEAMLPADTRFCLGNTPGMADCCLVPQVYNADRWGVDLAAMPRIRAIAGACAALEPFRRAHPDAVRPPA